MMPAKRDVALELARDLAWISGLVLVLLAAGFALSSLEPAPLRATVLLKNGTALTVGSEEELQRVSHAHAGDVASVQLAQGGAPQLGRAMSWSLLAVYVIGGGVLAVLERRRLAALFVPTFRAIGAGVAGGLLLAALGLSWRTLAERVGLLAVPVATPLFERGAWAVLVLAVGLAGPAAEELWFRGRLLRQVEQLAGATAAALATTVLFAAVHGAVMLPFFLAFGAAALALRVRTGGLVAPMIAHALNNLVSLLT